ncbi:hypothetical protein [Nonomuraea zeae]|uniref:hypothetical protein n=1 Tax=Nonomuraea zeae TaxID=1642303 RepID=UPI0019806388|nr:hypothetical protein [Nonomuraea zeae]
MPERPVHAFTFVRGHPQESRLPRTTHRRHLRIHDEAELVEPQGQLGSAAYMRITPPLSWSFNLEGLPFSHDREVKVQRTVHEPGA